MKIQNKLNKGAFSLIELSVVILIIGILILGVTRGSALLTKTKLSSARSLTNSSPVASIPDLVIWYETTLESSFDESNAIGGDALTVDPESQVIWYNNSPKKIFNVTGVNGDPLYTEVSINDLPAISFDGNDSLTFNSKAFSGTRYTVFIVERRGAAVGYMLSLGGAGAANSFGYSADAVLGDGVEVGDIAVPTIATVANTARISTFISNAVERNVYLNGTAGTANAAALLVADSAGFIGSSDGANFYTGDISEIIAFNRGLTVSELNSVIDYLGKKYNINVDEI